MRIRTKMIQDESSNKLPEDSLLLDVFYRTPEGGVKESEKIRKNLLNSSSARLIRLVLVNLI